MLATIREGRALGGHHAGRQQGLVEARRRQDRLDDRLEEAGGDEGDADPQRRGDDARDRREDLVEHVDRGVGDRGDAEHLERGNRHGDDDQRIDQHSGGAGEAGAGRSRRGSRGHRTGVGARGPGGVADADPGEQPVDVGGDQHGFDELTQDARDDQADEEDQAGAEQPRQELEDLDGQRVDRGEDLADPEEAAARP